MIWAEFAARYRATAAEIDAYVSVLPLWVNVWRGWMFLIFTLGLIFVFTKREARWLGLTMIVSLVAYNLVTMASGVGRFPSIAFVVLWTPLAVYLARRRPQLATQTPFDRLYARWVALALGTLVISVGFDVYNVGYSLVMRVP